MKTFATLVTIAVIGGAILIASREDDEQSKSAPSVAETAAETAAETNSADPQDALQEIRAEFAGFAGTSWYTPPDTLEITGETLEAHTGWFVDAEGEQLALRLCNALLGNYIKANTARWGLEDVVVYGQGDPPAILASKDLFSERCET